MDIKSSITDIFSEITDFFKGLGDIKSLLKSNKTKFNNAACIGINLKHMRFDFYIMRNKDKNTVAHLKKDFRYKAFSEGFYNELFEAAKEFARSITEPDNTSVTLMLPDKLVATDTVNLPNMNRRRNEDALNVTLSGLFANRSHLKINSNLTAQTKNICSYTVYAVNNDTLNQLQTALKNGGLQVTCTTFAASAAANAVTVLCPKLKGENYLLLDIKHHYSSFAFVVKGKTVGFYGLPFGYSILRKNKLAAENMLFNHDTAELAVLNAKEKAKAKQLTMMREENLSENADEDEKLDAKFGNDENYDNPTETGVSPSEIKALPKKTPRNLPKFMLRPAPRDENEFGYENFRIFVKWALNILRSNEKITSQGKPEAIYVNMPQEHAYLFDMVNEEKDENGIDFLPLDVTEEKEEIKENLELFGSLYALGINGKNLF